MISLTKATSAGSGTRPLKPWAAASELLRSKELLRLGPLDDEDDSSLDESSDRDCEKYWTAVRQSFENGERAESSSGSAAIERQDQTVGCSV